VNERAAATAGPGHPTVTALIGIVIVEAVLLALGTVLVLLGGIQQGFTPLTIALLVTAALVTVGVAWLAASLLRRRRRMLGGVVTWQVLQFGCALLGFQGWIGPIWVAWVILVLAIAGFALAISRPVVAVYGGTPKGR